MAAAWHDGKFGILPWVNDSQNAGPAPFANTYSAVLDGVSQRLSWGNVFNIVTADARTWSFWIKPHVVSGSLKYFAGKADATGSFGYYWYFNNAALKFDFTDATHSITTSASTTVTQDVWFMWTVTKTSSNVFKHYKNGSPLSTSSSGTVTGTTTSSFPFRLGCEPSTSGFLNGSLDLFSFWNTNLSDAQILELYGLRDYSQHSAYATNCSCWCPIGESPDTATVNDKTGNGFNATFENGVIPDDYVADVP